MFSTVYSAVLFLFNLLTTYLLEYANSIINDANFLNNRTNEINKTLMAGVVFDIIIPIPFRVELDNERMCQSMLYLPVSLYFLFCFVRSYFLGSRTLWGSGELLIPPVNDLMYGPFEVGCKQVFASASICEQVCEIVPSATFSYACFSCPENTARRARGRICIFMPFRLVQQLR